VSEVYHGFNFKDSLTDFRLFPARGCTSLWLALSSTLSPPTPHPIASRVSSVGQRYVLFSCRLWTKLVLVLAWVTILAAWGAKGLP